MNNTTDTKQASKDEINSFMKNFRSKAHVNFRKDGETVAYGWKPSDMKREITSLIRTEKLKLLAEVRERVMSEGDFVDAEILKKLYDKAYSKGYHDKGYENSYNSQDYRSAEDIAPVIAKIRGGYDKRSAALTKLEEKL